MDSTNSRFPGVFSAVLNQIFLRFFSGFKSEQPQISAPGSTPDVTEGARPEYPPQGRSQVAASGKRIQLIN